MKRISNWILAPVCAIALAACTVEKTQEGQMPDVDVDVKGGQVPKYDVDTADIDVNKTTTTVTVPDVDIRGEEKTIAVPDVDVKMPNEPNNQ